MVISTAYLGNIHYYSKLLSGEASVDLHENYQKQSYRNRADILTSEGVRSLTVPVLRPSGERVQTKDIRIDNSKRWRHQHYQAIVSAYGSSPYFFHYREHFSKIYEKEHSFLAELNDELQRTILGLLKTDACISYSDHYMCDVPPELDLRMCLSPKPRLHRDDPSFSAPEYYQVFSDTLPFAPNLSVIDLLFCEGPTATEIIRASICG